MATEYNTIDIEKALLPQPSEATLVPTIRPAESYMSLQSEAESYMSTIDGRTLHRDSVISLYSPTTDKKGLDPISERPSEFPTPRISSSGQRPQQPVIIEEEDEKLPLKQGTSFTRWLRWTYFSYYRRLFSFVFIGNMITLIVLLTRPNTPKAAGFASITYTSTIDAASVNLLVAIIARNEHFVNLLFRLACSVPLKAPLWFRARVAKIYCYGGLHSGCGIAAVIWYIVFTGLVARHLLVEPYIEPAIAGLTLAILLLLLAITIFAHPTLRQKFHNSFENTHRFAGWTIIGLFWAQVVLTSYYGAKSAEGSTGILLVETPAFWCLIIITFCIVYSWIRLRARTVYAEHLSPHAIRLHFKHAIPTYCMGVRITDSPLKETHAFATIPYHATPPFSASPTPTELSSAGTVVTTSDPEKGLPSSSFPTHGPGFSILISKAGDWTSKIIANPPQKLYFRGAPTLGVLRVATLFARCVVVTTGSGIGPCLSLFNGYSQHPQRGRPSLDIRILWSTPSPLITYGQGIVDEVMRADPRARIIDTRALGKDENGKPKRPDMVKETWRLVKEMGAEGVVVIGNPVITRKVVYAMETRGVPAFGPIWDS